MQFRDISRFGFLFWVMNFAWTPLKEVMNKFGGHHLRPNFDREDDDFCPSQMAWTLQRSSSASFFLLLPCVCMYIHFFEEKTWQAPSLNRIFHIPFIGDGRGVFEFHIFGLFHCFITIDRSYQRGLLLAFMDEHESLVFEESFFFNLRYLCVVYSYHKQVQTLPNSFRTSTKISKRKF